jgi:hypothetical protein
MAEQRKGPEKRKDAAPEKQPNEPTEQERQSKPEDLDPREEEGWSQPESSAQRTPGNDYT